MAVKQNELFFFDDKPPVNLREIRKPDNRQSLSFRKIRAGNLLVDRRYQRPVSQAMVNRIAKAFDPNLFGVITVSERDNGDMFILDGQHRVAAVIKIGGENTLLPCEVLTGKSYQDEAEIFHKRNADKKAMTAQDKFRGKLESGIDRAPEIFEIVVANGFMINLDDSELKGGKIPGVGSLIHVDTNYRGGHLNDVLELVRDTWGNDIGPRGSMISGLAMFLSFYRDVWDRKRFVSQLAKVTMERLHHDAADHKRATGISPDRSMCAVLVRRYNERILERNRLPSLEEMRAINMIKEAQRGK